MELSRILTRPADAAAGVGGVVLHRLMTARVPGLGRSAVRDDPKTAVRRWRAVTVLLPPDEIGTGDVLPAPLADLGERIEVRVTPAPGDKGTELAARFLGRTTKEDIEELRAALRRAKQVLEVGEVLRVDPQPHGRRKPTPQGALLEGMTRKAAEEGAL